MKYNKNHCVKCGEVRVDGSILCCHRLTVCWREQLKEIDKLRREKQEVQKKLTRAIEIGNKLIDTIAENQRYIEELRSQKTEVVFSLH